MNAACRDIRPLLSAYMDSEITPDELRAIGAHVAICAECAAILGEYRHMRSLVRALPQPLPPPRLHQAVFAQATPAYRRRAFLIDLGQRGLAYGALTVAVIALLLTASLLFRNGAPVPGLAALDRTPPTIISWSPPPGEPNSRINQPVRITFSEPMDTGSVLAALRIGTNPADDSERARLVASARWEGNTIILGDQGSLQPDTDYTIRIDPAIAHDTGHNYLQGLPQSYTFRTANVIAAVAPLATPTSSPETTPTPIPTSTSDFPTIPPTSAIVPTPASKQPTPIPTTPQTAPVTSRAPQAPASHATTAAPSAPPVQGPAPVAVATATPVPPPAPTEIPVPPTLAPTVTTPPTTAPTAVTTTPSPLPPTVAPTIPATPAPPSPTATPKLPYDVVGGFGQIYTRNGTVRERLGLPSATEARVNGAYQLFEGGMMFWREDTATIYVLFAGEPSIWYAFADGWTTGMAPGGGAGPTAGQFKPRNGFGKVWREQPDVQKRLGYALSADEIGTALVIQPFEHGLMLWTTASGKAMISVLYQNNTYERYDDPSK